MGYVEVLPTQAGGMLRDLYIAGFQLGMSSRGWATLKEEDGYIRIQDDFELITFDFVSDPSTEGAYLRPLQRRYERLRTPIDIQATYREFMRHTTAGVAHLKKLEKARGDAAPADLEPANGEGETETVRALAARAASISGQKTHSHAPSQRSYPPPPTLVACEASKTAPGGNGSRLTTPSSSRRTSAADARPGTPTRRTEPRARVEGSHRRDERVRTTLPDGVGIVPVKKNGWLRFSTSNKVAPRLHTPALSLRESWIRLRPQEKDSRGELNATI